MMTLTNVLRNGKEVQKVLRWTKYALTVRARTELMHFRIESSLPCPFRTHHS